MTGSKKFKGYVNLSGWSKFMNKKLTFCLILTFLLSNIAAALNVNPEGSGPFPTIQAAINAATPGEEVVLANGTYTGIGNRDLNFNGIGITVRSASLDPNKCIIDCNGLGRAFYFHNDETTEAKVEGLTIKNGDAYYGGAIECEEASPTIDNCIITNNTAAFGGAIDCFYASPVIINCIITNNTADYDGGAIEASSESSPTIKNCLITNNTAEGYGGAIDCYDMSSPVIRNCTIVDNIGDANRGGVHATNVSYPTIQNCILWNNGDDIYGATDVNFSCIQDGDTGTGNISSNPMFRRGPYPSYGNYYLSQTAAGQLPPDSNCVDAGFGIADDANIIDPCHTTRTDNVPDANTVDMGFHYPDSRIDVNYVLITGVNPSGNPGTIEPCIPAPGQLYKQFTEVSIDANPAPNCSVENWTIDSIVYSDTNTTRVVTMDANHTVEVKFTSTLCTLTTFVLSGNGTIDPCYPPEGNSFPKGSPHTLHAYPADTYGVNRWLKGVTGTFDIGNPVTYTVAFGPADTCTVTLDSNTTVAVEFDRFILDTRVNGGHGTISPKRGYQPAWKTVEVNATPDYGYRVSAWNGVPDPLHSSTYTVTMDGAKTVTVQFEAIPQHTLITTAASGATIDPNYPAPGQLINENTVVQLTATIPTGTVIIWSGTDHDNILSTTNTVTMTGDKTVNVSYRTPQVLHVPGQHSSIQDAINNSQNGDRIIISPRIGNPYTSTNINPGGRAITISSEHPDDPCCVAATIIDCQNSGRAFFLNSGETQDTVIEGFTIINGSALSSPQSPPHSGGRGQNGSDANGGAIVCYNGASPTISNCVFKNCRAEGQRGENATYLWPAPSTPPNATGAPGSDGQDGFPGGDGGHGFGGALYFGTNSNPRILHCEFINCHAIGGNAGSGGQGQDGQDGSSGATPAGDGGPGGHGGDGGNAGIGGDGFGGAIYFTGQNNVIIQYCKISDCNAVPGLGNSAGNAGSGGDGGGGNGTDRSGGVGGYGGVGGNGGTNGNANAGGIYSGNNCNIQTSGTTFSDNHTTTKVASFEYDAGNGGNGGNGGSPNGNGGNGGNAGRAGNPGDGKPLGRGGNGGNGGNGSTQTGRGGNGGNGSASDRAEKRGQGGQGGTGFPDGADGADGAIQWINFNMSSIAGSNYYGHGATATLNNCSFLKNHTDTVGTSFPSDGGAEYYFGENTATMNNCTFSENIAGTTGQGGAQFFGWTSTIDINNCTYNKNFSIFEGGAVCAGWDATLTVRDSTFADNTVYAYAIEGFYTSGGGAIYWDNLNPTINRTVNISNSYFTNNSASFGGGLYWRDDTTNTTTVANCVFTENSADHGGGIYWTNGAPTISGCIFNRNHANGRWVWLDNWAYEDFFGGGGAIFSFSSEGEVNDCTIIDNTTSGSGGGVYIGGDARSLQMHNCLINGNSAILDGGGIASYWFATPQITNCTIAANFAYDPADASHGLGGGISCSYQSNTTMTDCILWGNDATRGNQIAIGNNSDPVYLQNPAELTISYSDIQNPQDTNQIYVFTNRILNIDANNIDNDPCFVYTYFLASTSPCIDRGDVNSSVLGLDTYTTQTNNSLDTGIVDMGYHYALHKLKLVVIGHGTVSANPNYYDPYTIGAIFTLIATPDAGYRVKSWTGADGAPYWNTNTNTVTMTIDKTVTVEFEVNYSRFIDVPGDVPGIQDAINQAQNGDTVKIHSGTYVGTGFRVDRKNITILGDPTHPENVIIDCAGESPAINSGFLFIGDNQHSTTLNGLSIINSNITSISPLPPRNPGDDGIPTKINHDTYDAWHIYGGAITIQGNHTVKNCVIRNCSVTVNPATDGNPGGDPNSSETPIGHYKGGDGGYGGNAGGAGIYLQWGNANIINVIIENCRAYAGNAGNGAMGYEDTNDNYPAGASGRGGDGGSVFGAGIYIRSGSPYFKNTSVRNCIARAGNGGSGADGNNNTDGADGGLPGRVKGSGIYCSINSAPTFVDCNIESCRAYGGYAGNGGDGGPFDANIGIGTKGGYGGLTTEVAAGQGDIRMYSTNGAAIFCDDRSRATFADCEFVGNMTYGSISGIGGTDRPSMWRQQPRRYFRIPTSGAGVFCSTASSAGFNGCLFENNRTAYHQDYNDPNYLAVIDINDINVIADANIVDYGGDLIGLGGGLCLWQAFTIDINDCNFTLNSAPLGGGIYGNSSEIYISDCNITNNISMAGGGVLILDSIATINKSIVRGNIAGTQTGYYQDTGYALFGTGGGIYSLNTLIDINDTFITENYARLTGGGICLDGDTPFIQRPLIKNCLVTNNRAVEDGGGIAVIYFAEPKIQNCTITKNIVTDANSNGGGLFASYMADVIVKDTIFWANSGIDGSQIALSNGGPFTDMPAEVNITYSDIDLRIGADFNSIEFESGAGSGTTTVLVDEQTIYNEINSTGSAKVIVSLAEPTEMRAITNWSSPASVNALQTEIATRQNQVLSTLNTAEFTLRHKLANVAAFSGRITQTGLDKLLANPLIAHIEPVRTVYPMTAQGIPLMNALDTRGVFNGSGVSIAIVDSGVDYTHPRLGGGGFPNSKVIGGYDFGENDPDPMPEDDDAHGTCCAGIAAGSLGTVGDYIGGVAYNAKIYAIKIATTEGGLVVPGFPSDFGLTAWDWCISHRNDNSANPIRVISNSWGTTTWYTNNPAEADALSPAYTTAAQTAVDAGITILAASGNNGFAGEGISWPAAMSNVISVGAVYDDVFVSHNCLITTKPDQVICYSNTADILDIFAPSENAYTTDITGAAGYTTGDYITNFDGTSAACPYAAGAVAALQSAVKQIRGIYLTPAQVRGVLKMTGDPVTDTKVIITKPRVNLGAAIALLTGSVPIYRDDPCCTIIGLKQDVNDTWVIDDNNNISEDPNFVFGYYLSYVPAGQDFNSPCIDIGSTTAAALGLDTYTTRIDGVFDSNIVDLGYHYRFAVGQYDITVKILIDANYPGIHGYVTAEPNRLVSNDANTYKYRFYAGTIPTLTAVPDANYYVKGWYDQEDTRTSISNTFNFTVDANATYFVRFKPKRTIPVSGGGTALRNAINTAENGDTLIVSAETYNGNINIGGKQIKIYGVNPDDPNVVARTIIDCSGSSGLVFAGGEDNNTVIDGFTIINGGGDAGGAISINTNSSPLIVNVDISNCNVLNASGGAIYISSDSNPEFRNVNITNCSATMNGGGVYISESSNPIFKGCSIADCDAGVNGGAVYCRTLSNPQFINCSFSNNSAGDSAGAIFYETLCNVILEGCKFTANIAGLDAGAVMCSSSCVIDINNCDVADNNCDNYGGGIYIDQDCDGRIHSTKLTSNAAYEDGGAIYITDSNAIEITDCNISANTALRGGGIFALESPKLTINNCQINSNEAYRTLTYLTDPNDPNSVVTDDDFVGQGGGIYAFASIEQIMDCRITGNMANTSGGGIYIGGDQADANYPQIVNCLITKNKSGRDGGGISSNWFAITAIQNCTIADNTVAPSDFSMANGGGLYCSYGSVTEVNNSIIWGNTGHEGSQIAVGSGDEAYPLPAIVNVTYSDIQDPNPADVEAPDLDVVICIDTTGSMFSVLDSIKAAASDIVDRIAENTEAYRIAVVDFKDFNTSPYGGNTDYPYKDDSLFTTNKSDIQTAINGLAPSGGADWPESVYSALMHSIDGNSLGDWRSDTKVKKIIILMGDAPPHDPEPNTGYTLEDVTTAASGKNINIFSILTGGGVGNPTTTRYFKALAEDTGGVLIETPDGSKAAEAVIRAIDLATLPPAPVYVEPNCILNYWTAADGWDDASSKNIHLDPNFILGYYLSLVEAGQDYNSPCFDKGLGTAESLGLNTYTTRTDGVFDSSIVDLGYHYRFAVPQFDITVKILADANYPGIHGHITAEPNKLISYDANTATYKFRFYAGMIPALTAVPDANYYIRGWYDQTDTMISNTESITFTVDSNDTYFVRFSFKPKRIIIVSGGGLTLRNAVNTAENGDTLIVAAGTYSGGINIGGKQIKLYGTNPDDPNVVSRTIIDCNGTSQGFIFAGGETDNTTIDGFTIVNGGGNTVQGGAIFIDINSSPIIANVDIRDCNVLDANGGAIYISSKSSPEFRNVNITNCSATINGGGVYISGNSSPVFNGCSIADCYAGINGGGAYCDTESSPTFTDCRFTSNTAAGSAGAIFYGEFCTGSLNDCDFAENTASNFAGAVMCGTACIVEVSNCNFIQNSAPIGGAMSLINSNSIIFESDFSNNQAVDPVGQGGAIYCASSAAKFYDCWINNNQASASGGGAYFTGELEPNMHNCLVTSNSAGRDGGGISANWDAQLTLSNCTIAHNTITGNGFTSGFGGGLSCAYEANTKVINSIIWSNNAEYGSQISIGSNFDAANKLRAEVSVWYSDVQNGAAGVFVDTEHGCILNWDDATNLAGTSLTSPLFVTGYWGSYYLSQIDANDPNHKQDVDSPCVDSGEGMAIDHDLFRHTTRTDHYRIFGLAIDDGNTDMGYHYLLNADLKGDFNYDGEVNLPDLALFMDYWMSDGCVFPYFCHGRDLTEDGEVDFEDYAIFAANYGATETTPPYPDPMTWAEKPRSAGINIIVMKATTAKDNSGSQVWYHFVRYDSNGITTDFLWRTEPNLTDTGLVYRRQYGYKVQAKDERGNETGWSVIGYAVPGEDTTPPEPNQMTWAAVPYPTSSSSIRMVATTATDACGVEYYFIETSGNPGANNSNWQSDTAYEDFGLDPNTTYTYRVKARDKSPFQNETQFSAPASATTPSGPNTIDVDKPTPNPSEWASVPQSILGLDANYPSLWVHRMTAVTATDASPPVEYSFECVAGSGTSSGWITSPTYTAGPFGGVNHAAYKVRTRDSATPTRNVGSYSRTYHTYYGYLD